ncbi:DAK2 domain-containing protein [Gudongella sp. DL1XJH-153]|uniref:DAK2 domain-containing protein n=1 Tax=Gudongella sp. DL1XJH-153 TaxID=3409804 RepID=UPI003BB52BE7
MTMNKLNGEDLYYAFLSGANEVIKQKYELNRINVFPVPDGDTGSNLAFTMYTIVEEARIKQTVKQTMESIAEAALNGARGNSGIIFAQYINGMYMEMTEDDDVTVEGFTHLANQAVQYAYKSIAEPVEGTMITVIKDWALSLQEYRGKAADFGELMGDSLLAAADSLKRTPEKLKVLRDAHVVDSGAKGFVHFLEGFIKFIKTNEKVHFEEDYSDILIQTEDMHIMDNMDLHFRYCTEALIQGENLDVDNIKHDIADIGNSLVIAGNRNKVRIHIHATQPEELFRRLRKHGRIIQQKADDMKRQFEAIHSRAYPIALLTDSIADLPKEVMDKYQIYMLPLNLMADGSNYLDKTTISSEYFYKLMDEIDEYPSSSQPSSVIAEDYIRFLRSNYSKVIVITVSDKMSGTLNTFKKALEKLGIDDGSVALIDSKRNSGAEGLIVMKAAEMIHEGMDFQEILDKLDSIIQRSEIFVSVTDLKYMVKSGRISKYVGFAANTLNFKPVVSIDKEGNGSIIGKAFSVDSNTKKIYSLVEEINKEKGIERYAIVHADALERAKDYEKYLVDTLGKEPEYIMDISTIVAMSAGIGTVGVALISN